MSLSRRSFIALSAALPWSLRAFAASSIPVGLELYSVRNALKDDGPGTVRTVAQMGYQGVEFYAPYFDWTDQQTRDMKKTLDDSGIRCFSTHNSSSYFTAENLKRAVDKNLILGSKYIIMSSSEPKPGPDGWKEVADTLNNAADQLASSGLKTGYHNHDREFTPEDGTRPIEILAKNTKPSVALQLDVGTCVKAGSDPAAWIRANPGRIKSLHCKEWTSEGDKGYSVLFGEGVVNWKSLFAAAESVGGVEYYLVEQEGSRFSEFDTAKKCLEGFRKTHG
jgi:sugar phosphate isomerase/epimerase